MSQDEELAERQAEWAAEDKIEPAVPLTDWTPETELLTLLGDLVGDLIAVTVAINSRDGHIQHPKPLPRPRLALDELLARRRDAQYDDLLAEIERVQETEA